MTEIRSHVRGISFNEVELLQLFRIVDKFITDHSSLVDQFEAKYEAKEAPCWGVLVGYFVPRNRLELSLLARQLPSQFPFCHWDRG